MKKLTFRFIAAVLTFSIGIAVATLWFLIRRSPDTTRVTDSVAFDSRLDPHWIYISKDIRWQLPPKEIVKEMGLFYDGGGTLTVLYPSGELAFIHCRLRKDGNTNQISLGGLVEFSVDKGTWWRTSDGSITTASQFCVASMGPDRPGEATVERQWTIEDQSQNRIVGSLLRSGNESIIPLPDNFRDLDGLNHMLRFASECK